MLYFGYAIVNQATYHHPRLNPPAGHSHRIELWKGTRHDLGLFGYRESLLDEGEIGVSFSKW